LSTAPKHWAVLGLALLALSVWAKAEPLPASGTFSGQVDIGGRKLYLECEGEGAGAPTVILVSGYRNNAEVWTTPPEPGVAPVFQAVASFARVCAYDRPGTILDVSHLSRSDPVAMPRTADEVVAELHALLEAARLDPPYVLVAHSLGGLFARLYAALYPGEVAGLVLVDAWPETLPALLGSDHWAAYVKLSAPPPPGLEAYRDLEQIDFAAASARMAEAAARRPMQAEPLFVLSPGKPVELPPDVPGDFSPEAFEKAWREGQNQLAGLVPSAKHEIAGQSDHYIQIEQPDLVIDAVRAVVDAVRDPASWRQGAK
jgi:pimeloyl-ACP methyl ester carboxylesterase